MAKANELLDPVITGSVLDVLEDIPSRCNLARVPPRIPVEAKRGHVRVGSETGVLEEAPGAAENGSLLKNGKGAVRELFAEDVGGVDAAEAGAQDENVVVLDESGFFLRGGHVVSMEENSMTLEGDARNQSWLCPEVLGNILVRRLWCVENMRLCSHVKRISGQTQALKLCLLEWASAAEESTKVPRFSTTGLQLAPTTDILAVS